MNLKQLYQSFDLYGNYLRSDKLWGPAQHLDGRPGLELLGRPKVDDLHCCVVLLRANHVLWLEEGDSVLKCGFCSVCVFE